MAGVSAVGLEEYRKKRRFDRTPEPAGKPARTDRRSFVVQQHAARSMHWDFRLEHEGVLLSWAVPKGPSLDPKARRLAVRTEDHPVEYATFEGTIPKGEYGAGTVLLWDRGTWRPLGDPHAMLEKGHLRFELDGEKLHGRFHLVRTKSGAGWLLIKGKDAYAKPGDASRLVQRDDRSVSSGRRLSDIAAAPDRVWQSGDRTGLPDPSAVPGARRRAMPKTLAPELATLVDEPPAGDDWLHEIKLDGYRVLARLENGRARLFTRKGHDWSDRLGSLARTLGELPVRSAWLDGEIVVLDTEGRSDFGALQNAIGASDEAIRYFAFDLLYLDGWDLRDVPLVERKAALRALLESTGALAGRIRYNDHVAGGGEAFFEQACALGLEGIVSKHAKKPYAPRRTKDWRKVKCMGREEAIVCGFSEPKGSRSGLGALLLCQHANGELRYVGKVGTGFDARTLAALRARLSPLRIAKPAFTGAPRGAEARGVHWVKPELVVEVRFAERTKDGKLRHPSYVGVREDKPAREVRAERAMKTRAKATRRPRSTGAGATVAGVRLTNPDRVYYPDVGLTKLALCEYYEAVAERMVPHVADRPLTLVRCPEGIDGPCFYAQRAFEGMPAAIRPVRVNHGEGDVHTAVHDVAGVVALAQMGVLEIHTWCARIDRLERPDQLVFDLDPGPGVPWEGVVEGALAVRERIEALGLAPFAKTTGGKGLHVVVPIVRNLSWDDTKAFAHALARELVRREPRRYTATLSKAARRGKIYVDYLRNARGATAVCAYSTRAKPGAPVSAPVSWEELARGRVRSDSFDVRGMLARLREPDPWAGYFDARRSLTKGMRAELGLEAA